MRFFEFKAPVAAQVEVYAVGDSHAEGLSYAKGIKNYAQGGQPSTASSNYRGSYNGHPTGIESIPKGSTVVIAQGCNDAANASRAFQDSKGKTPLVPPQTIAGNVAKLVNAAEARGLNVIFVLFPNGDAKIKPYYGGEYQEKVRQAIKSALSVPVIDMDGAQLADGVHATPSEYKQTGAEVLAKAKPAAQQAPAPTGTTTAPAVIQVPSGRVGIEVADVQKALAALGYDLGPTGVDGIRGVYTSDAVKKFQQDNKLAVDGDPGPETVGALNQLISTKGIKFVKSTAADVKSSGGGSGGAPRELPPLSTDSATSGKVGELLNFIARYESRGDYNIMVGGKRGNLTGMTVREVLDMQKDMIARGHESTAVGRYQYIRSTLLGTARQMGLSGNEKFDEKTQDALAIYTLRTSCNLDGWLSGKVDDETFLNKIAQIWASIPKSTGGSAYAGVGSNKAGTSTTVALNTLQDIKTA